MSRAGDNVVIIPTYLPECADSIRDLCRLLDGTNRRVTIVANSSASLSKLESLSLPSSASVISEGANLGFGGAVNAGAGGGCATILVVNDDVVLSKSVLELLDELTERMATDPLLAAVSIVSRRGCHTKPWPSTAGLLLRIAGLWSLAKGVNERVFGRYQFEFYCVLLSGAGWQATGGFRPIEFPLYFEDADIVHRLVDSGFRVETAESTISHKGSATARSRPEIVALHTRGAYAFLLEHASWSPRLASGALRAANCIGMVVDVAARRWTFVRYRWATVTQPVDRLHAPLPPFDLSKGGYGGQTRPG